jgi:hypothetical protein
MSRHSSGVTSMGSSSSGQWRASEAPPWPGSGGASLYTL